MTGVRYASVCDVKRALDVQASAYADRRILRYLESSSRSVDLLCHRRFWPQIDTRYFDWPGPQRSRPWVLWLEQHEVISVTTLTSGGTEITSGQYYLEPNGDGPPYDRIEIDLSTSATLTAGDTHQRAIALTATFGFGNDTTVTGALAEDLTAAETAVDVTDSSELAAGDTALIGSEYMLITGASQLDTGVDLSSDVAASTSTVTIPCDTDTGIPQPDEVVTIDSERMLVLDTIGTNLIVKRAYDGTVLAAHSSGASLYCLRTLTVERGALGTTAATHTTADVVYKHTPPGLVRDLTIAEAIVRMEQESAGYARTVGSGDSTRNASLAGLQELQDACYESLGRQMRHRSIG